MIEKFSGGTMITGEFDISRYQILVMIKALELEMKTGMKMSKYSVLKSANQKYNLGCKTKKQAVEKLSAILAEMNEYAEQMKASADNE